MLTFFETIAHRSGRDPRVNLEAVDYAYGRLKDQEIDWQHYVLRVGLQFANSSQKTCVVTRIRAYLDGNELEYLGTAAGKCDILTSKGWRILDQPREESMTFTLLLPAATIETKFVTFRVPDLREHGPSYKLRIETSIAWRIKACAFLDIKPEPVLPPSDSPP
jgi:hypothetical protein